MKFKWYYALILVVFAVAGAALGWFIRRRKNPPRIYIDEDTGKRISKSEFNRMKRENPNLKTRRERVRRSDYS